MTPGDLVIYRTRKHGVQFVVFLGFVGGKALIRMAGQERTVFIHSLEPL